MMVINVKAKKSRKLTCAVHAAHWVELEYMACCSLLLQHVKLVDFVRDWAWKENDINLRFEQKRSGVDGDGV
jgi:hypothetical protein